MPLPVPVLDTRDFDSLMAEAKARIPAFAPEWTNFNDSDPGMALVQLQAWLTEVLLFQVNRLPDMAYVRFLNMIGTTPAPARAARADLSFRFADLSRASDPLTILVPKAVQVGVKDPSLTQPLIFETDETLRGINAALAVVIVPAPGNGLALAGSYDAKKTHEISFLKAFRPFGSAGPNRDMYLGLLLRPVRKDGESYHLDRFPSGELALTAHAVDVGEKDALDQVVTGPLAQDCPFPWETAAQASNLTWSVCIAPSNPDLISNSVAQWQDLPVRLDETGGLLSSGRVWLDLPENLPAHSFMALPRSFWTELGLMKPPTTKAELIDDLNTGVFLPADLDLAIWKGPLGIAAPDLTDLPTLTGQINAVAAPDFAGIDPKVWTDLGYSEPPAPYGLVWLRARQATQPDRPVELADLRLNTVAATAAQTRLTEVLGVSSARPNQTFALARAPVLIDPVTGLPDLDLALVPAEGGQPEPWLRVDDFAASGRTDGHYRLDPQTGGVTLGDGVHGRIPVAGSRLVALRYRTGGGKQGNVTSGKISQLKTALPQVASVSNPRAARGGSDAETLDEAMLRAPSLLRSRDRAVTSEDFADLACRTPGVALKTAIALPLTRVDRTDPDHPVLVAGVPGSVTLVLLPDRVGAEPQPREDELALVAAHLNARRLITTELHLIGPTYRHLTKLDVEIIATSSADLKAVQQACSAALEAYFSPVEGGEDGQGWPFGTNIFHGNVFRLLLAQPGVDRVSDLKIALEGVTQDDSRDVIALPAGTLPALPPGLMRIEVRYGR